MTSNNTSIVNTTDVNPGKALAVAASNVVPDQTTNVVPDQTTNGAPEGKHSFI